MIKPSFSMTTRWALAVVFCVPAVGQPAPATRPADAAPRTWELLAHGSDDRLWYAFTRPAGSQEAAYSFVRDRAMQVPEWHGLGNFPGRILAIGESRGQLVASLEGGEWERISAERFASGPRLPGRGDILALAGDGANLWAVGFAEGARPEAAGLPASRSATGPAATSQASPAIKPLPGPTTRPEQLQLYRLASETWTRVAALPVDVRTVEASELGIVVAKDSLFVAYKDSADVAWVLRFAGESRTWVPAGSMKAGFAVRKLKLLSARGKLIGWAVGKDGVGSFFFPPGDPGDATAAGAWREQPLSVPANMKVMDASAAAARDELHLFVIHPDDEDFYEQKYDLSGKLTPNSLAKLAPPPNPNDVSLSDVVNWGLFGVLMVVTLAAANKGGPVQVVRLNKVELPVAPFALRLAAGLVDLWPLYVGFVLTTFHAHHNLKPSQFFSDVYNKTVGTIATATYFLHAFIGEITVGRSVGKMCVGLRVVGLDGNRAPAGATLLRNLMRLIEVPVLLGFPLLAIFFNPLRQRLGDFAAGTVVVAKLPPKGERVRGAVELPEE